MGQNLRTMLAQIKLLQLNCNKLFLSAYVTLSHLPIVFEPIRMETLCYLYVILICDIHHNSPV